MTDRSYLQSAEGPDRYASQGEFSAKKVSPHATIEFRDEYKVVDLFSNHATADVGGTWTLGASVAGIRMHESFDSFTQAISVAATEDSSVAFAEPVQSAP